MITPMKRLQTNFRILKSLLIDFEYFTLNKSGSKSIPYPFEPKCRLTGDNKHCTKGVKNDFLLIFNKIDDDISIGFVINYLEDYENPTFMINIKYGGSNESIKNSEEMNIATFREKLNYLNRKLKSNNENPIEVISLLFFDEKYNIDEYKINAEKEVIALIGDKYQNYINLKEQYLLDKKELGNKHNIINGKLSELDEYKRVKELEALLDIANKELEIKQESFEKQSNISESELNIVEQEKIMLNIGWDLRSRLSKIKGKFPRFIGDKIKEISDLRSKINKGG
jgi:hypothetical protein